MTNLHQHEPRFRPVNSSHPIDNASKTRLFLLQVGRPQTKSFQKTNFQGREEACGPKGYNPPDFVEIANAYKIKTFKINNNDEIENLLDEILNYKGPVVCDVNCHEFHAYEPKLIGWKTPIEDMYPYLKRDELKDNLSIKMHKSSNNPFMPDITTKIDTME